MTEGQQTLMVPGQRKLEVQSCLCEAPLQLPGESKLRLIESIHTYTLPQIAQNSVFQMEMLFQVEKNK